VRNYEKRLRLHTVKYTKFLMEFKRYAYAGDYNSKLFNHTLKACKIRLFVDASIDQIAQMEDSDESDNNEVQADTFVNDVYVHHLLLSKQGKYNIFYLQLLALLYCKHESDEDKYAHVWTLLNPKLDKSIPLQRVIDLVDRIRDISIVLYMQVL
jgi:hypothetical protein